MSQGVPISTLQFPCMPDLHLVHPVASGRDIAKTAHLSILTALRFLVGRALSFVEETEHMMSSPDNGLFKKRLSKLFRDEWMGSHKVRDISLGIHSRLQQHWDIQLPQGTSIEAELGPWLYNALTYAQGPVLWGSRSPFDDADFRQHSM